MGHTAWNLPRDATCRVYIYYDTSCGSRTSYNQPCNVTGNLLIIVHEILWKISELLDYLQVEHIIKQALHMHCGFFKGYFLQE